MALKPALLPGPRAYPPAHGLYDPRFEHDACGVGFVARLTDGPHHDVVSTGVEILCNLEHRGALGADETGDGAGVLIQTPHDLFRAVAGDIGLTLPAPGAYGVGMLFLPQEAAARRLCEQTIEQVIEEQGQAVIGWRDVPVKPEVLAETARETMPVMRQVFVGARTPDEDAFERTLYVIRKAATRRIYQSGQIPAGDFYACSFSARTVVYKGLLVGLQIGDFFPDLVDKRTASQLALVHQRYSTNTLPTWPIAQPFRFLAHNGEINTLRGNINWMGSREPSMKSELFGDKLQELFPIIEEGGSDSAMFDNAYELLVNAGRSPAHAIMMMIPEAWENAGAMSADKRAFYEFHSAMMEPWDGPAAIAFTDGRAIGAVLDRNGLRPARYLVTKRGEVIMASEMGTTPVAAKNVESKGRLQPGRMFLIDLRKGRIIRDNEVKSKVCRSQPYRRWLTHNVIELRGLHAPPQAPEVDLDRLLLRQRAFGLTYQEVRYILQPMIANGQEAVGAMGNDTPLAVMSERPQLMYNYFKQLFAQVTNPPIDPLREGLVMSLMMWAGRQRNLLDEVPEDCAQLLLHHPILTNEDMDRIRESDHRNMKCCTIGCLFRASGGGAGLEQALKRICREAEEAIADECTLLILSDRGINEDQMAIPALLATGAVHHHLIRKGIRMKCGLLVESGEVREVMHFATLLGYGANGVNPYLAFETLVAMLDQNLLPDHVDVEVGVDNYINAIKKGLLKTFSRMGISTLQSYAGAQIFEAVGLNSKVVEKYFTGTPSRIQGIGLTEIAEEAAMRHRKAYAPANGNRLLEHGGDYHVRSDGELHQWNPETVARLQTAVRLGDWEKYLEFAQYCDREATERATIRGLMEFVEDPIPIEEVEPASEIVKRFATGAMSFGSISKETHESLAIAMNRLSAKSNTGEGGEDPARFTPYENGDNPCSAIKQVASGRFGVTSNYLAHAEELQIKIAQGAKPGEGGQLPGHKVNEVIARVRHTTPGVSLISPPPHHDIYSIEDLAQLIFDLKNSNPAARISVKLVAEVGVGTIAAGVAKAKSDVVLISGHDGGTGASPQTSIKHAGLPWELGLAETQQVLLENGLRDRIVVQTDGQLKTGRDAVIGALLGAEEFGFSTAALVTLGCCLLRKCHLNTCSMGIATQDPELRKLFSGSPDHVVNYFTFVAEDIRRYMARLGFRKFEDMVGRVDRLSMKKAIQHWKAQNIDLSAILRKPVPKGDCKLHRVQEQVHFIDDVLDRTLIKQAGPALEKGEAVAIDTGIRNVDRTVGAMLSYEISKRYGDAGLPDDTITVNFRGTAGQSFGAFLQRGVTFNLYGDANDYVGKGMCGGRIVVTVPEGATYRPEHNVIAGNVICYGATAGEVYINGEVGERFCVRNSGVRAVVEAVGDHGCEYMTGGIVVVLGHTGRNFAAGMSGGIAYVWDEDQLFDTRCNLDMVDLETVSEHADRDLLRAMIENHAKYTGSTKAEYIIRNWRECRHQFVKVMPLEYRAAMERMRRAEERADTMTPATEEVFSG